MNKNYCQNKKQKALIIDFQIITLFFTNKIKNKTAIKKNNGEGRRTK